MSIRLQILILLTILPLRLAGQAPARTRVVVLGVEHTGQLVSEANQPGTLVAFLDSIRPDAVCVERPPEEAARGDWYEFTYEVTGIVLPWAAGHRVAICPMDWMPSHEDQMLAFGTDLEQIPEIRPFSGFQAFLTFPDSTSLRSDFFAGEDSAVTAPIRAWISTPATRADRDFPRRLYLYRTFLQAQRVRAAARSHRGGTVVVVVGYFHKGDLESILGQDTTITLVQPSTFGRPSTEAIARATTRDHRAAILSFNLLGRQAETGTVAWDWIGRVLAALDAGAPSAEGELFAARLAQLTGTSSPAVTVDRYRELVRRIPDSARFTWTGVKDGSRIDSFFDPFGNLSVRQRATVELAGALHRVGKDREAASLIEGLATDLGPRKGRQLVAYAREARLGADPGLR